MVTEWSHRGTNPTNKGMNQIQTHNLCLYTQATWQTTRLWMAVWKGVDFRVLYNFYLNHGSSLTVVSITKTWPIYEQVWIWPYLLTRSWFLLQVCFHLLERWISNQLKMKRPKFLFWHQIIKIWIIMQRHALKIFCSTTWRIIIIQ